MQHRSLFLVGCMVVLQCLSFLEVAEAKKCSMRTKNEVWKHSQGKFVNEPLGSESWVEYNREGNVAARFTVLQSHGNQLVLRDDVCNFPSTHPNDWLLGGG